MVVKGFDHTGPGERGRNLARRSGKRTGEALAYPEHFEKMTAVVRPERQRIDPHAFEQAVALRARDDGSDAFFALSRLYF